MALNILAWAIIVAVAYIGRTGAASTYELEAKRFVNTSSRSIFDLYDRIAAETYSSTDDEDFDAVFSKLATVKQIAEKLVEISREASTFNLGKIDNKEIYDALEYLRFAADLFVLGEEYFSSVLINLAALDQLSTDKDITPYMGGMKMPNYDDSPLALYPDIENIQRRSNDSDELQYYWEMWREKNLVWSSVNFYTIVEAFKKAANIFEVPVLEFWYDFHDYKNFLHEMEAVMHELMPFYQQLHAFVRHELAQKYGADVVRPTGPIPDHLFQQVLVQAWRAGSILDGHFPHSALPPYDGFVSAYDAREMIDAAERFYASLGFEALNASFYRDQLREHEEIENAGDCAADIFDMTPHVYMKYCRRVDFRKYMQNHGYLARLHYAHEKRHLPAYYFDSYDVEFPVGEAVILSASTPKHLAAIGLAKDFAFTDDILLNRLFRMAIHTMFNIQLYFVHTKVMSDLLHGRVEMERVNKYYWQLMDEYAGVEPPVDRPDGAIDFSDQFYRELEQNYQLTKFVSEILGYQFYAAFCNKTDQMEHLHNCDFFGNKAVGNVLKEMMALGSSKPWEEVIAKILPESPKISGGALLEYYAPVHEWLKARNEQTKSKIGWHKSTKKVI